METINKTLEYQTKGEFDFIDITDEVKKICKESGIQNGFLNVQTLHTTAAVILNENEPLLLEDIKKNLEKIASGKETYQHDDFTVRTVNVCSGECANGRSHCRAVYLPCNITLNLFEGKIQFGMWQRILVLELDRPRPRQIQVQIIGE